jgi:hypothetical protein
MFKEKIEQLLGGLSGLPDGLFIKTDGGKYRVLWLLDRQKPSVESNYDFDEERLGLTKDGKIIWGFDSGCSCPSPWSSADYGDESYQLKEWKEFELSEFPEFDKEWQEEIINKINSIIGDK